MRLKAGELRPGYFLVGDGRSRLYISNVENKDGLVTLSHQWGTLEYPEDTELEAARPMEPKLTPTDL